MGWIGEMGRRVAALVRRDSIERELEEEMRLHLESRERELIAGGMDREEARYAAARTFGNAMALSERGREAWGWRWLEDLVHDAAFGLRTLRKSPAYALTAVTTLVLGIGATTAIFSVVNTVLLRPLPYANPGRLVQLQENHIEGGGFPGTAFAENFSYANYLDLTATRRKSLVAVSAYRPWTFNVSRGIANSGAEPVQADGAMVSSDFFEVLGVKPALGRGFVLDEQQPNAANVAVLSYRLWQSQFAGDLSVLGKILNVSDVPHVIIGVMPPGFDYPNDAQVWTPLVLDELRTNRKSHLLGVIGRLATGASREQAESELGAFADGLQEQNPGVDPGFQVAVRNLRERITAPVRPALLVLLGAVGLLLLAACANVANLVLMRNTTRVREFAVRAALGAGNGRLLRQCLVESALLGLAGAAGGVLLTMWCLKLVIAFAPKDVPRLTEVRADGVVLAFAVGLSLITAMIFGAVPALAASRTDPNEALKEGAKGTTSVRGAKLRGVLVVAEIALALILLSGGGLLMNSFVRLSRVSPGFDARNVLTANLFLPDTHYTSKQVAPLFDRVLERVRAIPGAESAAVVNTLPVSGGAATDFVVEGQPKPKTGEEPSADIRVVAGDYLTTLRIPLLRGRWFDAHDTDTSVKVMVINETMAEKFWPGENPVGKRVTMYDWGPPLTGEVVGVAGNVKSDALDAAPGYMIYWPESQFPSIFDNIIVRTSGDPMRMASSLKVAVWSVDRDLPLADIATMETRLKNSVGSQRVQTMVLCGFALLALLIATIGIYGAMAYSVGGRLREIGIRVALGADAAAVRGLVLGEGLRWAGIGIALGLAGALALGGLLSSLLYGVAGRDPVTLGATSVALLGVAAAACYLPARRATRVDAVRILRAE
jgi:putative ABC transport system permease protein